MFKTTAIFAPTIALHHCTRLLAMQPAYRPIDNLQEKFEPSEAMPSVHCTPALAQGLTCTRISIPAVPSTKCGLFPRGLHTIYFL